MTVHFRKLVLLGVFVSSAAGLSGCLPLVVGGAVMGGMVATDRRTSGTYVEDEGIEIKATVRIRERLGDRVHVNVTSYNRQVLLTGEAPSAQDKQLVEQIVAQVENVRATVSEISILGNSTLTQRSSDAVVTGRVRAKLLDAQDLLSNSFKVVTERGTVYLMGRVTEREANRATEIITATQGVQRLVRVLEVLTDEELARTQPTPKPATDKP
jgi:osmotically-inducible protein OsmY